MTSTPPSHRDAGDPESPERDPGVATSASARADASGERAAGDEFPLALRSAVGTNAWGDIFIASVSTIFAPSNDDVDYQIHRLVPAL